MFMFLTHLLKNVFIIFSLKLIETKAKLIERIFAFWLLLIKNGNEGFRLTILLIYTKKIICILLFLIHRVIMLFVSII